MSEPTVEPVVEPVVTPVTTEEPTHVVEPVEEPVAPTELVVEPVAKAAPEKTGVAYYDNAGSILHSAGIDAVETFNKVRDNGNVIPEDVRKDLVDKLGESQVYMLESGLTTQVATQAKEIKTVLDSIGGEEVWTAVNEWASKEGTLPPEQITTYNEMLAKGGQQAIIAAQKLKEAYMADPNTTVPATNMLNGDTAAPVSTGIEPISRMQYTEQKRKAVNDNNAVEVTKLEARARYTSEQKPDLWRPQFGRF